MKWPWSSKHKTRNGHEAQEARAEAEKRLRDQQRKWPEVIHARDELARIVERSMRGHA
jgi:hypothetical protein